MVDYSIPAVARETVSSPTHAITTGNIIFCDTSSNSIIITLPSPAVIPIIEIKRIVNNVNSVTVNPNASETIEGGASLVLGPGSRSSVSLVSDGTNWWVV